MIIVYRRLSWIFFLIFLWTVMNSNPHVQIINVPFTPFSFIHFLLLVEWPYPENRRKFFEDYGKREKFDVLVAENWYSHAKSIAKFTYSKVQYFYSFLFSFLITYKFKGFRKDIVISRTKCSPCIDGLVSQNRVG